MRPTATAAAAPGVVKLELRQRAYQKVLLLLELRVLLFNRVPIKGPRHGSGRGVVVGLGICLVVTLKNLLIPAFSKYLYLSVLIQRMMRSILIVVTAV